MNVKSPRAKKTILAENKTNNGSGITMQKYAKAWDMFFTGHTIQQIMASVGLSRSQIEWLTRVGDEANDMPSFASRASEISAAIGARDMQIADLASQGAVEWSAHRKELAVQSTQLAKALVGLLGQLISKPASAMLKGTATSADYDALKQTGPIRDALKALSPYTEIKPLTELAQLIQNNSGANTTNLPKSVQENLRPESTMPAYIALVEEVQGPSEVSHDPMLDLIPTWTEWTDAEQEHFSKTGERPGRLK